MNEPSYMETYRVRKAGGGFKKAPKAHKVSLGKKSSFRVHPGKLHQALGIPQGEKIGQARMKKALHSKNPETRREAASGIGLSHMKY